MKLKQKLIALVTAFLSVGMISFGALAGNMNNGVKEAEAATAPANTVLYVNCGACSWYRNDGYVPGIHYWGGSEDKSVQGYQVDSDLYVIKIPSSFTTFQTVRYKNGDCQNYGSNKTYNASYNYVVINSDNSSQTYNSAISVKINNFSSGTNTTMTYANSVDTNVVAQYMATVAFKKNDTFKATVNYGSSTKYVGWDGKCPNGDTDTNGTLDSGDTSARDKQMIDDGDPENHNIKATVSGRYTIYFKIKKDNSFGFWIGAISEFSVSFDTNGHGASIDSETVGKGGYVTKPADPSTTGYTFGGWYKEAACTNAWNFDEDTIENDTTLYAKWDAISYNIEYDLDGGTHGSYHPAKGTYDEKLTLSKPTKTGYTFLYWTVDKIGGQYSKNGSTNWISIDRVTQEIESGTLAVYFKNLCSTNDDTVTITAHWKSDAPTTYTVTFDVQGHGTAPQSQTISSGGKVTKPTTPTADGHIFGGWYTEAACTNLYNFSSTVNSNFTLYAYWGQNYGQMVSNGTSPLNKWQWNNTKTYTSTNLVSISFDDGPSLNAANQITIANTIKNAGYNATFFNYVSSNDITNHTYDDNFYKLVRAGMEIGNHTSTATDYRTLTSNQMATNANDVETYLDNILGTSNSTKNYLVRLPSTEQTVRRDNNDTGVFYKTGTPLITHSGLLDKGGASTTREQFLDAIETEFDPKKNPNGGFNISMHCDIIDRYGSDIVDAVIDLIESKGCIPCSISDMMKKANAEMIEDGNYQPYTNKSAIVYRDQGGLDFSGQYTIERAYPMFYTTAWETNLLATQAPTKTGNEFGGFYYDSACTDPIPNNTIPVNTGNVIVYAKWIPTYVVSFDANGGSTPSIASKSVTYGSTYGELATTTRDYYNFGGWFTGRTDGDEITPSTTVNITSDQTLYAHWNTLEFYVQVGDSEKIPVQTKHADASGTMVYEASTANKQNLLQGQSLKFFIGNEPLTYENGMSKGPDTGVDINNVVEASDHTWTIHNDCNENVYIKVYNNGTYQFWINGYYPFSPNPVGVYSGTTFYIKDSITSGGHWCDDNAKVVVYFYSPIDEKADASRWSNVVQTKPGENLWSVTVPDYNGKQVHWSCAIAVRLKSGTPDTLPEGKTYWDYEDNRCEPYNSKGGHYLEYGYHNGIEAKGWETTNGDYFMYSDGGVKSGDGIYVDPSNTWGKWDMENSKLAVYFFSPLSGDSSAYVWSEFMTLVPGEESLYETNIPKLNGADVEWAQIIVVRNDKSAVKPDFTGQKLDQSVNIVYSAGIRDRRHITFTNSYDGQMCQNIYTNNDYGDGERAEAYGTNFLTNCKCSLPNKPTGWSTCSAEYANMSLAAQYLFWESGTTGETNLEQAAFRYDYIINKYGKTEYPDFANRELSEARSLPYSSTAHSYYLSNSEDQTVLIVVIAASATLLATSSALLLLLKKKKKVK